MWWVDAYINDELRVKVLGPFSDWEEAEYAALAYTMDSSDYSVYQEQETVMDKEV